MEESSAPAHISGSNISSTADGDRKLRATLWIFLAAGAFFTLVNLRWPIARNAWMNRQSALDAPSQRRIFTSLARYFSSQTILLISRRISALKWVDRIVVLNQGVVEDQGTHKQLIARSGLYSWLHSTVMPTVSATASYSSAQQCSDMSVISMTRWPKRRLNGHARPQMAAQDHKWPRRTTVFY
jgi:ABC-type antimicrobial peptide transport system ATPase subunit